MTFLLLIWSFFAPFGAQTSESVKLTAKPQNVYIEKREGRQLLNFDLIFENKSPETLTVQNLELSVYDKKGVLVLRRFLDNNGARPSIFTISNRETVANQKILIFNPFYDFEPAIELGKLHYEIVLTNKDKKQVKTETDVFPVLYETKTDLILPVKGRQIVWDGHDFYAHHRRFDYMITFLQQLGFNSNFMRYSYDFVPVNEKGEMFAGDEKKNESYFGFGANLYAAGNGIIVAAVSDQPDNRSFDESKLTTNQMVLFGNYIVIDHQNGEFSVYAHLKQSSSKVKVGDKVKQGQLIGQIGASGSANFPHLHYELQNGADAKAEGLPSYFKNFKRVLGSRAVPVKKGQVDTGDILEN